MTIWNRPAAAVWSGVACALAVQVACTTKTAAGRGEEGRPASARAAASSPELELPVRRIPNIPEAAEAYYAPDSLHVIAQTQDAQALHGPDRKTAALTYTFTDQGTEIRRINDRGQDACSYFFPDQKRVVWTSTRDHLDWPLGNWSNDNDYPQGAELYSSALDGSDVQRLTDNKFYDAEVTVSPDGKWIFFTRQIDGKLDLWRMRPDGTGQEQISFTDDWQEGAPYPLPDNEHILFRAWRRSDKARLDEERAKTGKRTPTPMTIFTARYDGSDVQRRTFTDDMNWAPFPAPDGRHFAYVRVFEGKNFEVVLGDLAGGEPRRLTFHEGFDGFPAFSPDGTKLLFARGEAGMGSPLYLYTMDVTSLDLGPKAFRGVPAQATPPPGWKDAAAPPVRPAAAPQPDPAFEPARLKADVTWLADPARTGRGIGTPGLAAAADYIEARFKAVGLRPAWGAAGYQQPFEAPWRATLGTRNSLAFSRSSEPQDATGAQEKNQKQQNGQKQQKAQKAQRGQKQPAGLALGQDWVPFGFSDDGRVEAELVFAGYGISAPALGYDDYAGLDVKGKIVVVAQDFPREQDAASPFRDPKNFQLGDWRQKAITARERGAVGLLAVRDDWHHPGKDDLPRWSGTVTSRSGLVAARVTLAALRAAGVDVAALAAPIGPDLKPRSKPLGIRATLEVTVVAEKARTANVAGLLPGSDPSVAGECVIVGAHYDHLGLGGEGSLAPAQAGEVHPGADDNASGTSGVLELARLFSGGPAPRRPILFVAFTGEESGLLGSSHLVKELPAPCSIEKAQLMVNLDMIGRPTKGRLYLQGVDTARGLRDRLKELAAREPRIPFDLTWDGDGYAPSDSTAFYTRGVPVVFAFTGAHLDYHRPSDTADKVDAGAAAEVARLAGRILRDAADAPERFAVVQVAPPKEGAVGRGGGGRSGGAYLGAIPEFGERPDPGVLLSGVRPGSPAERAGLLAGDVILRVGTTRVLNLQDLSYALKANRPGETVELERGRGGSKSVLKITLEERK